MSVDTYLKQKNTAGYARVADDDVLLLLAPTLVQWAGGVRLDVTSFLGIRRFTVTLEHRHTEACAH